MLPANDKALLISTPGQGKPVKFVPALTEECKLLKAAAKKYYYPQLAIKHLAALTTGLNGKHNVFIPNTNDFKANTFQQVVVVVPGIMATVERRPNDELVVTGLKLSDAYKEIDKGSMQRPGVYSVSREGNALNLKYRRNGRITAKDERKVIVGVTNFQSLIKTAKYAESKLSFIFGDQAALKCDFDLFYSPIGSKLGGMRNYNPIVHKEAYAFSGLLADAIEQSVKQNGIEWASQGSGSVVLTQALKILTHKNISFADQKHVVTMYKPTSNPNQTLEATKKLGMYADKKMLGGNLRANFTSVFTNIARAKDANDPYTWKDYKSDLIDESMGKVGIATGATGAITTCAGALLAGSTIGPAITSAGAVAGVVGAIHFALSSIRKQLKNRG